MRSRLLVRHFLSQFIDSDLAPESDRHQLLALIAAGVITLPLFTTVFMSVQYLIHPLQTPAWTQVTAMGDRMIFCGTSMLVSAMVATLEWDALALGIRDSSALGVLPISRQEIVRAKGLALMAFAGGFIIALNALPTLIHPTVMVANLPLHLLALAPLIATRAISTLAAGVFGFASVLALRECLYLVAGRGRFEQVSVVVRSVLMFSLLLLLLLAPSRLSGRNDWIFDSGPAPVLERPVAWFVAVDTLMTGRLVDDLPRPDLSRREAESDDRLALRYRNGLPHLRARAWDGAGALLAVIIISSMLYFWNARRAHLLPAEPRPMAASPAFALEGLLARAIARRPARRAGFLFLTQSARGSPVHRTYLIVSAAIGGALWIGLAPAGAGQPMQASEISAQTLLLTALIAGFRAAIRTSADTRAIWLFGVADTGNIAAFRDGVRAGVLTAVMATVVLLVPVHAAAWGMQAAAVHALNGAALGWLLVEIACGAVEQPLVRTIPANDALNTVGAVFLGAIVIGVFVVARIEFLAMTSVVRDSLFVGAILSMAIWLHGIREREHYAAAVITAG